MNKISLKSKMLLLNSCLVLLTVFIISLVSILSYTKLHSRTVTALTQEVISQVAQSIRRYSEEMQAISQRTSYDYSVQKFASSSNLSATETALLKQQMIRSFDDISQTRNDINGIWFFADDGRWTTNIPTGQINANYNFSYQSWYKQMESIPFICLNPHKQSYLKNSGNLVLSFLHQTTRFDADKLSGFIMVDINLDSIKEICSGMKLGADGYVIICDREGNVIYHPDYSYMYRSWDELYMRGLYKEDDNLILKAISNPGTAFTNGTNLITTLPLSELDWIVIGVYPQTAMLSEQAQTTLMIGLIGLLITAIGVVFTMLISSMIFNPIRKLQRKMKDYESGILTAQQKNYYSADEIGRLNKSFDTMLLQIRNLLDRVRNEERAKRKAEFNFLQAQINPHFLYNTLDSIIWMAEGHHPNVVPMTEALAKFFRIALSGGREVITVREELSHAENYLIIQKMRYEDKFDYRFQIEEEIYDLQIVKFILQPIIENALYHGIKNIRSKGFILIKGSLVMDHILLQVMDDGAGMDEATAQSLLTSPHKKGVGLVNVNERIKLYYGEQYGLEIVSERRIGTVIDIWLPALPYQEPTHE